MMLVDTKERALPAHRAQTLEDYLVYLKHVALYQFAAKYCAAQRVLDLGCGEGYGSDVLAKTARVIVAADYDLATVAHARKKYAHANVAFVVCDAQNLPFAGASFDTVISFEVIEHIPNVRQYLEAIKRVARHVTIISTPNRVLRLLPFQKPWNRFHLREYDAPDLLRAVSAVFVRVQVCGITARADILDIETRRVKQNPLVAYPKMIVRMILPNAMYESLKRIKSKLRSSAGRSTLGFDVSQFSAEDFKVTNKRLRECINLVAVSES